MNSWTDRSAGSASAEQLSCVIGFILESRYLAPGTITLRLGAVRRLVYEAAGCGLLSLIWQLASRKARQENRGEVRQLARRPTGQKLWHAPGGKRLQEKRDRALLAILFACGLRRH